MLSGFIVVVLSLRPALQRRPSMHGAVLEVSSHQRFSSVLRSVLLSLIFVGSRRLWTARHP
jgi:hypothetical protein